MRGLYISNQKDPFGFFQRALSEFEIETCISPTFFSEYILFQIITSKKPDFLILNSILTFNRRQSDNFAGVAFIRYLRMLGFDKQCISFGQDQLQSIVAENVSNSILFSAGNSYVVPYQTVFQGLVAKDMLKVEIDNFNLYKIVKGDLDFEKVKHEWTNYWGIYRLFEAHQKCNISFATTGLEKVLPKNLMDRLYSFEGVAMKYLNHNEKYLPDHNLPNQINRGNLIREQLQGSNPKILYIDDQADFGWSEILQQIIYGEKANPRFKTLKPEHNFNEEKILSRLQNEVMTFQPHVLLLDLRLRNEKGVLSNPDELSGLKLLTRIRKQIPNLPVIIFTASNNAKTIVRCKELGAYGVWQKEGIDQRLPNEHSLKQYFDLISLIYECILFVSERANKFLFGLEFPLAQFEKTASKLKFQKWLDRLKKSEKFKILCANNFDVCLLDTNFFLYNAKMTLTYYKTLFCLIGVRKSCRKNITILNSSYDEMIKHAKYHYNKLSISDDKDIRCKMARFALKKVQEFNDQKELYVSNLCSTFDVKAYADPEFASIILDTTSKSRSILFITNDNALRQDIFQSLTSGAGTSQNANYQIMNGKEMITMFWPLVELIETVK